MARRLWVKRPGASATQVQIHNDDLVDDVRDKILLKYANSLGRTFDAPDVVVRIQSRSDAKPPIMDRLLAPEESIFRLLDTYYPAGQNVEDALLIDIPARRTPKASPRPHPAYPYISSQQAAYNAMETSRPEETSTDYFPPMPALAQITSGSHDSRMMQPHVLKMPEHTRSMSVLQTGLVPALPSPGGAASRRHRPKHVRQHTSSPTVSSHPGNSSVAATNGAPPPHFLYRNLNRPRLDSHAAERPNGISAQPPPLSTPPIIEASKNSKPVSTPPTPSARDHNNHRSARPRKSRKPTPTNGTASLKIFNSGAPPLDNSVPPINVLIVEDNHINLKVLEAFMKRLRVRWSTAMNGQIAVNKWRAGGFHLVLMDIQLPIMSGLEATKEIRRLERVNGIGVFSNSAPSTPHSRSHQGDAVEPTAEGNGEGDQDADPNKDRLVKEEEGHFKSPVIIVALTASSLQSDRHEALAAGCNDFLTKPVGFPWLERKVKEWGCMQALIDFDGWRKWKHFATQDKAAVADAKSAITTPPDGAKEGSIYRKVKKDRQLSIGTTGKELLVGSH